MTVEFADIEAKFERIFGFIRNDLQRLLSLDTGGNFAAAALITCACETLSHYRHGAKKGEAVFLQLLPGGPFQSIGRTLYDVLRNGLVHEYNARDIRAGRTIIRLAISWRKHRHLSVIEIDGLPNLVLNVTELCRGLLSLIEAYRAELQTTGEARDHFFTTYRSFGPVEIRSPEEIDAWQEIVGKQALPKHALGPPGALRGIGRTRR